MGHSCMRSKFEEGNSLLLADSTCETMITREGAPAERLAYRD